MPSYLVQSSDVLDDARVNVIDETTNRVVWYKERFLSDDEIVEQLVYNHTSTVQWRIHRPKRGWYIRVRAPTFPPGTYIPLVPIPTQSSYCVDGGLMFRSRTNEPVVGSTDDSDTSTIHSYPPTPPQGPTLVVRPPSPSSPSGTDSSATPRPLERAQPRQQITQFILCPYIVAPQQPKTIFSRAFSVLSSQAPSTSYSFSLSRLHSLKSTPPPPYSSSQALPMPVTSGNTGASGPVQTPLLVFHDRTRWLSFSSSTGTIEIDETEENMLGLDTGFWIAVALAYLDFLNDRESYLAALND